jgi:hypothetical protein
VAGQSINTTKHHSLIYFIYKITNTIHYNLLSVKKINMKFKINNLIKNIYINHILYIKYTFFYLLKINNNLETYSTHRYTMCINKYILHLICMC